MQSIPRDFAFLTWKTLSRDYVNGNGEENNPSNEHFHCVGTLATFGVRSPLQYTTRFVCVNPPKADCEIIHNVAEIQGAIAFVVRGGCSFTEKAIRLQRAGAIAMIVGNTSSQNPTASFTMGISPHETMKIRIPCIMISLQDVRRLLKDMPPSRSDGIATLTLLDEQSAQELAAKLSDTALNQCNIDSNPLSMLSNQHSNESHEVLRCKYPCIYPNYREQYSTKPVGYAQVCVPDHVRYNYNSCMWKENSVVAQCHQPASPIVFAFLQWATSATEYCMQYTPLSDFCFVKQDSVYNAPIVFCDPIRADSAIIHNSQNLQGSIVLVERGGCSFPEKIERIQNCGAIAVLIANDDTENPTSAFVMSVDKINADRIRIPSVMLSLNVYNQLKNDAPSNVQLLALSGTSATVFLGQDGASLSLLEIPEPIMKKHTDSKEDTKEYYEQKQFDFLKACRNGDFEQVNYLIGSGSRKSSESSDVSTLNTAKEDDPVSASRELLVNSFDAYHLTPLHHACISGNYAIVKALIELGANIFSRDITNSTPLHASCLNGHVLCAKLLLDSASCNQMEQLILATNIGGCTPLHYAARSGVPDTIELLLSSSSRVIETGNFVFDGVDNADLDGSTPLHIACRRAHADCVMYLIAANANLNIYDKIHQECPVQITCKLINDRIYAPESLQILEKLITAGACVEAPANNGTQVGYLAKAMKELYLDNIKCDLTRQQMQLLYLRAKIFKNDQAIANWSKESVAYKHQLEELQKSMNSMRIEMDKKQAQIEIKDNILLKQQHKLEQLQQQMTHYFSFLTILTKNENPLHAIEHLKSLASAHINGQLQLYPEYKTAVTEQEKAQEAGLLRDLGKRCYRSLDYQNATTYFEKSLKVYELPGVGQLLQQAQLAQSQSINQLNLSNTLPNTTVCNLDTTLNEVDSYLNGINPSRKAKTLSAFHDKLKEMFINQDSDLEPDDPKKCTNTQVFDAITNEILKMSNLDENEDDCEFEMSCKWIEWLLVLPWNDPSFTRVILQGSNLKMPCVTQLFDAVTNLEECVETSKIEKSAKIIQRFFRTKHATTMSVRKVACIRIQKAMRQFLQRKYAQISNRAKDELLHNNIFEVKLSKTKIPESTIISKNNDNDPVDYLKEIDPLAHARMMPLFSDTKISPSTEYVKLELIRSFNRKGNYEGAMNENLNSAMSPQNPSQGYIQQLIKVSTKSDGRKLSEVLAQSELLNCEYFIWKRWINTLSGHVKKQQCIIQGPYSDLETTDLIYNRSIQLFLSSEQAIYIPSSTIAHAG